MAAMANTLSMVFTVLGGVVGRGATGADVGALPGLAPGADAGPLGPGALDSRAPLLVEDGA